MTKYEVTREDINASLDYLEKIYSFARRPHSDSRIKEPILIGGWAVHVYNPWFGSLDIDIIANSKTQSSLKHFLKERHEFKTHEITPGEKTVAKTTQSGRKITIDFISKAMGFEGHMKNILKSAVYITNLDHIKLDNRVEVLVPKITVLWVYKLKAAWDRSYRLDNELSEDAEWEEGKLAKDYGDLAALIDGKTPLDPEIIGRALRDFTFLREAIDCMNSQPSLYNSYTRGGKEKGTPNQEEDFNHE